MHTRQAMLRTSTGEFPLHEYRLRVGAREWTLLHTEALLTAEDESRFFRELRDRIPYGVALWPAAIALAHEVAARAESVSGTRVLELGAGTGLPGIVAASLGARVVQTDRQEMALRICRRNGERNHLRGIELRLADWGRWDDASRYDWILGADILYVESMHGQLRAIFESNLASGGRVLLADPFRRPSFRLLEALEDAGWSIALSKWRIGEDPAARAIGLYELTPPR